MFVGGRELTGRGDLSCVVHDGVKHVLGHRNTVIEIVRSDNSHLCIGHQGWGRTASGSVEYDITKGYVVLSTSLRGNIISLRSLQDEGHESIKISVHILAPSCRGFKKVEEPSFETFGN